MRRSSIVVFGLCSTAAMYAGTAVKAEQAHAQFTVRLVIEPLCRAISSPESRRLEPVPTQQDAFRLAQAHLADNIKGTGPIPEISVTHDSENTGLWLVSTGEASTALFRIDKCTGEIQEGG